MNRREFIVNTACTLALFANPERVMSQVTRKTNKESGHITLFLCGDVMTGRGIDQVLPYPSDPQLYEPYVSSAESYVELAEGVNGPITRPVNFSYIWGDALKEFERVAPDVRIINLETSVTTSNDFVRGKDINYRMHPKNIPCITAANIDCCVLANNHVMDWGYDGLAETLKTLRDAKLKMAGAGQNLEQAEAPAVMEIAGKGRVVVFSFGMGSSGIPWNWAAHANSSGVNLLPDLSNKTIDRIRKAVEAVKREGDIVVASIHWGSNWGYKIPREHIQFAHKLIDKANVNIIHGHSSHHVLGLEVYKDRLIIYGCGDFLNDYEGIGGYEQYRGDLALMYFVQMEPVTGKLVGLEMVPTQNRRFRSNRASKEDTLWLSDTLNREGRRFNSRVGLSEEKTLVLYW